MQLTTNGTNISNIETNVFQAFQAIDISLYGLSNDEYFVNTKMQGAFDKLIESCRLLYDNKINFRQTLVLNNNNWKFMEDYLMLAIDLGATTFSFSLPVLSGKLLQSSNPIWSVSKDTTDLIYRNYRKLVNKYRDKIDIIPWKRTQYSSVWKDKSMNGELFCSAGSLSWWMSEKFDFRPCALLPQEYLQLPYEQWLHYVESKENIDWHGAYNRINTHANKYHRKPEDICSIFSLISK